MKTLRKLKKIILFFIIVSMISCNTDYELIGVWQRNDFSENFEYKLHLNSNHTGMTTSADYFDDGKALSSAEFVQWTMDNKQLNLIIGGEKITTPYSFNSDGQLILTGLTDIPFNKLEE